MRHVYLEILSVLRKINGSYREQTNCVLDDYNATLDMSDSLHEVRRMWIGGLSKARLIHDQVGTVLCL